MITALTPTPDTKTAQTPPIAQQSLGKDDFLQLLVAQLSAQDPMNPMESQDFSAQLAQFSSLEQITNVNSTLQEIKTSQMAMSNSNMISLIGKTVDVPGSEFGFAPGADLNLSYVLPQAADAAFVDVYDASGELITTLTGTTEEGANLVNWGGATSSGGAAPAGAYSFNVRAIDANGEPIESETYTTGKVTDVLFEEGAAFAVVNGQKISAAEITRVSSL